MTIGVGLILILIWFIVCCAKRQNNLDSSLYSSIKGKQFTPGYGAHSTDAKLEQHEEESLSSEILLSQNFQGNSLQLEEEKLEMPR